MHLNFERKRNWDIGTPEYLWMRATMPIPTGGSDLSECTAVLEKIRPQNAQSWFAEWKTLADRLDRDAHDLLRRGRRLSARGALMRASNALRVALMRLPADSSEYNAQLQRSRNLFAEAGRMFDPPIEPIEIPMGTHRLPGYYVPSGRPNAPTLIGVNGGDSTSEEMVHLLGFTARERGWNCVIFDGPGQYLCRLINPGLVMMPEWEVPTGAVIDWLVKRPEVDPHRIALFGWSLSSTLALRAAAFDRRIAAVISNGLVIDVYEAFLGVWPKWLRKAKPETFDRLYHVLERASAHVRNLTKTFYAMHGVETPTAMMNAWKRFSVKPHATQITCPTLFVIGEAEYAEQQVGPLFFSVARFLQEFKAPFWLSDFGYDSGWAASHCQMGAQTALSELTFDWLEMVTAPNPSVQHEFRLWDPRSVLSHVGKAAPQLERLFEEARIRAF